MIKLIHDYVVGVTPTSYALYIDRHRVNKKGEAVYENIGYYGTLTGAINAAKNHCIRQRLDRDDVVTLVQALEIVKSSNEEFAKVLKEAMA